MERSRKRGPKGSRAPEPVVAVQRALDVLEALHQADQDMRLTDLALATGLSKPTAYRMLVTLISRRLVVYNPEAERYGLGPKVLEYGLRRLHRLDVRQAALPTMRRLREETQETVTLSLLVGDERQYVEQLESPQEVRQTIELGRRVPLYSGGSGKAILAFLPLERLEQYLKNVRLERLTDRTIVDTEQLRAELEQVREQGYAASRGERQAGAASVAAPVRDHLGDVIGCISVSGPAWRFSTPVVARLGPLVREAAAAVSQQLGYVGPDGS